MYKYLLFLMAVVIASLEITVYAMSRIGILGKGETAFMNFGLYGGAAALLSIIVALAAIIYVFFQRSALIVTVWTLLFCVVTDGLFIKVLIWGPLW
jgi:hypothetical protein